MPGEHARITVSEVRQAIFRVSGRSAEGAGSVAGQIFHRAAECALAEEHPACWKRVLTADLDEEEWLASLYTRVLGPELARMQGALADSGQEVLKLWRATQQYVHWFCGLLREAMDCGRVRYDAQREEWIGADSLFQAECDVEKVFFESGWSGPVRVSGRLDQFVRGGADRWCLVEFKVGGGHAEADAAQACLYHELLGGAGPAALLHFGNEGGTEEMLLPSASMAKARKKLVELIGALAGVIPDHKPAVSVSGAVHAEPATRRGAGAPTGKNAETSAATRRGTPNGHEADADMGRKLEQALAEFNAEARVIGEPIVGPTFVRYLIEPERGVPVRRIEGCGPNLHIRLGLDQEPVIHRVEGKIAVDIQRRQRELVPFDSLRSRLDANHSEQGCSKVLAGVDLRSQMHFLDLARECPHLLVGGGTGSGKTEWLRAAVASLIVTNTPETLRLAVVDPKKNAFTELAGSPFLWREDALIDSPDSAVLSLLRDLIAEMTRRNGLLGEAGADSLVDYRRKTGRKLPRLVMVVDEFAELLLFGGRRQRDAFEEGFIRIAAVGRAAGIHLMLATQRPSRKVVSGNLKANLPGKIALRVVTRVDSGVLMDQPGAELLLGKGDLLLAGLTSDPVRLQSAWLSESERRRVLRGVPG